jgi:hypothetical protein
MLMFSEALQAIFVGTMVAIPALLIYKKNLSISRVGGTSVFAGLWTIAGVFTVCFPSLA